MAKAAAAPKQTPTPPVAEAPAAAAQVQEPVAIATVQKKGKTVSTGDYIQDVAIEIEGLSKPKALSMAKDLSENIESNYFKLGGALLVIKKNSWYEGAEDFKTYVAEAFGFQARKADYLIEIYEALVTNQIPWEKVKGLGWTKLKDIAKLLKVDNVDEWVAKVEKLTVRELQALLAGGGGEGGTQATTDEIVKVTLKFHKDQAETWNAAVAKAKGELETDVDTVAADGIAMAYLGGTTQISTEGGGAVTEEGLKTLGIEAAIEMFNAAFPEYVLSLEEAVPAADPSQ